MTWAFVPAIPKLLMDTRSLRSAGHSRAWVGTVSLAAFQGTVEAVSVTVVYARVFSVVLLVWENVLRGLGVSKLMFGGIFLASSDRTILMMLEIPDAPSPWPRFGLTY